MEGQSLGMCQQRGPGFEDVRRGLRTVVPESLYSGPPYDKKEHLYTGVKFRAERADWVITEKAVLLFPSENASLFPEDEAKQLSLF